LGSRVSIFAEYAVAVQVTDDAVGIEAATSMTASIGVKYHLIIGKIF